MFFDETSALAVKGMIEFPCGCGSKDLVYIGATGKASHACPNCKRFAIFDYDSMTAIPSKALKGATQKLRQNCYH